MVGSIEFKKLSEKFIKDYVDEHLDKTNGEVKYDVYNVWYCKALKNHKGLFSTTLPDGMYYEVTFNGDKEEFYIDAYKKWENQCISLKKEEE